MTEGTRRSKEIGREGHRSEGERRVGKGCEGGGYSQAVEEPRREQWRI